MTSRTLPASLEPPGQDTPEVTRSLPSSSAGPGRRNRLDPHGSDLISDTPAIFWSHPTVSTFLAATGAVFWSAFFLLVLLQLASRARVQRWLDQPSRFAYSQLLRHRLEGVLLATLRRLGGARARRVAPEVVAAFRSAKLQDYTELRRALHEAESLPTVRRGLAALGVRSIFEVPTRAVRKIPSPYTHPQQYPAYYIPGVPARTFYDPAEFEWVKPLEEGFSTIKQELLDVLAADGQGFKAYISEAEQRLAGWNTFNLFFYGRKFEDNCARCPKTTALLESLPRFERDHIMFSSLNPHARIPPHTGPMNGIIRAHLSLIVPPGCYIRVGAPTSAPGKRARSSCSTTPSSTRCSTTATR